MKKISRLRSLPSSKADMEVFRNAAIGEILDGEVNPLEVEIKLKRLADTIAEIRKDVRVRNVVMEEAEKFNKQTYCNADISVINRKTANYSLDAMHMRLKAELKGREALLKETGGVDPDTGEIVVTYKESEVLIIKLK